LLNQGIQMTYRYQMPLINLEQLLFNTGQISTLTGRPRFIAMRPLARAEYQLALDCMTLTKNTSSFPQTYEFRFRNIDRNINVVNPIRLQEYSNLYMPFDGVVFYYAAGSTLPNGETARADTLRVSPIFQGTDQVSTSPPFFTRDYFPFYSGTVADMYLSNLNLPSTDTILRALIRESMPPALVREYAKILGGVNPPVDLGVLEAVFDYVFQFIKLQTSAGQIGIFANVNDLIGVVDNDGSDTNAWRLDIMFSTMHRDQSTSLLFDPIVSNVNTMIGRPLNPGENPAEIRRGLIGENVAQFAKFIQRIPDTHLSFRLLGGHPLCVLLVCNHTLFGSGPWNTTDFNNPDRVQINNIAAGSNVDVVVQDYTTPSGIEDIRDKSAASLNLIDVEIFPNVLLLNAPPATPPDSDFAGSTTYYDGTAATQPRTVPIMNPDGLNLTANLTTGNAVITGTGTGGTNFFVRLVANSSVPVGSVQLLDILNIVDLGTGTTVLTINIQILPPKVIDIQEYEVDNFIGGTSYDTGGRAGNYMQLHPTILGQNANIWCKIQRAVPAPIQVTTATPKEAIDIGPSGSRTVAFNTMVNAQPGLLGGVNTFHVYKLWSVQSGPGDNELGITTRANGRVRIFLDSDSSHVVECHELAHGIKVLFIVNPTLDRHFNHSPGIPGDYQIPNNLMQSSNSGLNNRITARQALILNSNIP